LLTRGSWLQQERRQPFGNELGCGRSVLERASLYCALTFRKAHMRVISGLAKGRSLRRVPGEGTRPISDRVKESLFNIAGWRIPDCRFLDLFAGTGSVGIEALSRGAAEAVFVDKAAKAIRVVRENLRLTGLSSQARVIQADAFKFIAQGQGPFDVIYVAPPQYRHLWSKTLLALDGRSLLAPGGLIVVQIFPKEFEPLSLDQYLLTDQRTYGSTTLCFYGHRTEASEPP
jgi:16S rRNA (guanine966-N2)-methyltransferase